MFPVPCHEDCLSCLGSPDRCERCRDQKAFLHLGRCLSVCPAGYFPDGHVCAGRGVLYNEGVLAGVLRSICIRLILQCWPLTALIFPLLLLEIPPSNGPKPRWPHFLPTTVHAAPNPKPHRAAVLSGTSKSLSFEAQMLTSVAGISRLG